jgi:hypothetical protein
MQKLFQTMYDAYDFVVASWDLSMLDGGREAVLHKLSLQTIECAYFIRDQSKIKNFCKSLATYFCHVFMVILEGIARREML